MLIIGIEDVLKYFSLVWLVEHWGELQRLSYLAKLPIKVISNGFLQDHTSTLWKLIGNLFCHPLVRDQLFQTPEDYPPSPDSFLNTSSLDKVINLQIVKWFGYWLDNKSNINITLYPTAEGINIQRLLTHWISVVASKQSQDNWDRNCNLTSKHLKRIMYECIENGQLRLSTLRVCNIVQEDTGDGFIRPQDPDSVWFITSLNALFTPFALCQVGADPWIRCYLDIKVNSQVATLSAYNPLTKAQRFPSSEIICVFQNISYEVEINCFTESLTRNDDDFAIDMKEFDSWEDSSKERKDHLFKTTGKYSTALYKYLHILAREGVIYIKCSAHVFEGPGGVAALTHKVFGSPFIIYNSKISLKDACPHRATSYIPAELEMIKNKITLVGVEEKISGSLNHHIGLQVARAFSKLCDCLSQDTLVIFKTYCNKPYHLLHQINIISQSVKKIRVVVPKYSSYEGFEVFIIGKASRTYYGRVRTIPMSIALFEILKELPLKRKVPSPFQTQLSWTCVKDIDELLLKAGYIHNV
ncbi:hypothetical protein ACI65C_004401 [Semiaphis heraclei]